MKRAPTVFVHNHDRFLSSAGGGLDEVALQFHYSCGAHRMSNNAPALNKLATILFG